MNSLLNELEQLRAFAISAQLPRAFGLTVASGDYRASAEDFQVNESGVKPSGEGEHWFLRIRKTGQNTRWVAKELARHLRIPFKAVSYAGLKDRHALTEQWFSVHTPGQPEPDFRSLDIEGTEILDAVRHNKKLRQGELSYNSFFIRVRELSYASVEELQNRLQQIALLGVPNYFGRQRFGQEQSNLDLADGLRKLTELQRERRSFVISALRSALFNGYLAQRVTNQSWAEAQPGEVTISDRPRGLAEDDQSLFVAERLPAGMMWGAGAVFPANEAAAAERDFLAGFPAVCELLESAGARASRRVLRARVANMRWQLQDNEMSLEFAMGPGSYATAVLQEIGDFRDLGGQHA